MALKDLIFQILTGRNHLYLIETVVIEMNFQEAVDFCVISGGDVYENSPDWLWFLND